MKDKELIENMKHKDWYVRCEVARRINKEYLLLMINDENWWVKYEVARRIDEKYLPLMIKDKHYIKIKIKK